MRKDFFKLIRYPNLIIIIITQYVIRLLILNKSLYPFDVSFAAFVLSTVLIAAAGYIINDYYDVRIDIVNCPQRVVIGKTIKPRWAIFLHFLLNFIAVGLSFLISKWILLINIGAILLLWVYSIFLKRLPFIGNFCVSLLTAATIWLVGIYYQQFPFTLYILCIFAFLISLIREVIKDMEDIKGDKAFACKTLPIIWGIAATKIFIYILVSIFTIMLVVFFFLLKNHNIGYFSIIMFLALGWLTYKVASADTKKEFHQISSFCKFMMLLGIVSTAII